MLRQYCYLFSFRILNKIINMCEKKCMFVWMLVCLWLSNDERIHLHTDLDNICTYVRTLPAYSHTHTRTHARRWFLTFSPVVLNCYIGGSQPSARWFSTFSSVVLNIFSLVINLYLIGSQPFAQRFSAISSIILNLLLGFLMCKIYHTSKKRCHFWLTLHYFQLKSELRVLLHISKNHCI